MHGFTERQRVLNALLGRVTLAVVVGLASVTGEILLATMSDDPNSYFAQPALVFAIAIGIAIRHATDLPLKTIIGIAVVIAFTRHTLTQVVLSPLQWAVYYDFAPGWTKSDLVRMIIGNVAFGIPIVFVLWAFSADNMTCRHALALLLVLAVAAPFQELLVTALTQGDVFAQPSLFLFYTIQLTRRFILIVSMVVSMGMLSSARVPS